MLGGSQSFLSMAFSSGIIVGGVLLILLLGSVGCWAVILYKFGVIRRAVRQSETFQEIFWSSREFRDALEQTEALDQSPLTAIFREGYAEWKRDAQDAARDKTLRRGKDLTVVGTLSENVERALRRAMDAETDRLEALLVFLATLASAAPFIGLFGTVWGIMESFRDIGEAGSANLAVVAPGISEALIATAAGLAAAIPAVVAYNYFNNCIRRLSTDMEGFISEFLNIVTRHKVETVGESA